MSFAKMGRLDTLDVFIYMPHRKAQGANVMVRLRSKTRTRTVWPERSGQSSDTVHEQLNTTACTSCITPGRVTWLHGMLCGPVRAE